MRHESKPRLADKRDNSSPVEQQISGEMALNVVPVDVVYDEWECVYQREKEEGVCDPSMEDLKPLIRNSGK